MLNLSTHISDHKHSTEENLNWKLPTMGLSVLGKQVMEVYFGQSIVCYHI